MEEDYEKLHPKLTDTEFGFIPPGFHETEEVYELVKNQYPELCEDDILCRDTCKNGNNQPEWKHRVRNAQQALKRSSDSRVRRINGKWYYEPTELNITQVPEDESELVQGNHYNRWKLHDEFGGQRHSRISTPPDHPVVFLFTDPSGEDYGYEDKFLDDDTFLYNGEETEGDMEITGGNKSILDHKQKGEEIHLFEDTEYSWIVTYLGQFEYLSCQWDTLFDKEEEEREAVRFRLQPVEGTEITIEEKPPSTLSKKELFNKAKTSSSTQSQSETSGGTGGSNSSEFSGSHSYQRSEIVKRFALRDADGICQGCEQEAPFIDKSGDPFLEVHHLHRRSDGGPDHPRNVIALCPNCHRRVHQGKDGEELNQGLIEKAKKRNNRLTG